MRAITVEPKKPGTANWEEVQEPDVRQGSVLVETIAVGVCGTDVEIAEGKYGWAPPGKTRLILGHESLGRVLEPDPAGRLKKGDLVVGIVRRPDPVLCPNCAVGVACGSAHTDLEVFQEFISHSLTSVVNHLPIAFSGGAGSIHFVPRIHSAAPFFVLIRRREFRLRIR
jgi:threonine dehydrogenase-like Zn-dependent dehydrogenase